MTAPSTFAPARHEPLLFMGGTGGRRTAAGLAFISALTAALPALTKNLEG